MVNYSLNFGLRSIEEHVDMVKLRIKEKTTKGEEYREHKTSYKTRTGMTRDFRPVGANKFRDPGNLIWGTQ